MDPAVYQGRTASHLQHRWHQGEGWVWREGLTWGQVVWESIMGKGGGGGGGVFLGECVRVKMMVVNCMYVRKRGACY